MDVIKFWSEIGRLFVSVTTPLHCTATIVKLVHFFSFTIYSVIYIQIPNDYDTIMNESTINFLVMFTLSRTKQGVLDNWHRLHLLVIYIFDVIPLKIPSSSEVL